MKSKINQQNSAKDCDDNEIIITDCDGNISISSDETDSYLTRFRNYSAMSITGVHPMGIHTRHMSLLSLNENWDNDNYLPLAQNTEDMHLEWCCCFTCGVSWPDQHVTLDCKECGGYSMNRPCVLCEGQCGAIWKRDLHLSHSTRKARWHGECETKTSISPRTQDFDQNSNIQRGHCPQQNC